MYLTTAQVADQLQMNRETILRWLRAGELEGLRAGRQWRIERDKLESFLNKDRAAD